MDSASLFRALLSSPSSSSSSMQCTKRMEKALERGEGRTRGKRKRRVSVSRHRGTNYYLVPADTPVELREIAPLFAEWTRTNADASSYYSISFTLLYSRSPFLSKRIVAPPFFLHRFKSFRFDFVEGTDLPRRWRHASFRVFTRRNRFESLY